LLLLLLLLLRSLKVASAGHLAYHLCVINHMNEHNPGFGLSITPMESISHNCSTPMTIPC